MTEFRYLCFNYSIYRSNFQDDGPQIWDDFIVGLGTHLNCTRGVLKRIPYFVYQSVIFYWSPDFFRTLINFICLNRVLYLCWGFPERAGRFYQLKMFRLWVILKMADIVFVNEEKTKQILWHKWRINAVTIPYYVDMQFFFPNLKAQKQGLLVVGNKDRDESFLDLLGREINIQIIRVTSDKHIENFFLQKRSPVKVVFKPNYQTLKSLYQHCEVFLMPVRDVGHAAGQTAVLEAIASGCPIVMTNCVSSNIFEEYKSVFIAPNEVDAFKGAITNAQNLSINNPQALEDSRELLSALLSLEALSNIIRTKL